MDKKESTQQTPAGYEIPVPTRGQVEHDLAKASQPLPPTKKRRKRKK